MKEVEAFYSNPDNKGKTPEPEIDEDGDVLDDYGDDGLANMTAEEIEHEMTREDF